jgi:GNAT superfamily N-acetyltransferase
MSQTPVEIVPIEKSQASMSNKAHKEMLSRFECGVESLETYLSRFALRHSTRDGLSRTYLALAHPAKGPVEVAGYYSVSSCAVDATLVSTNPELPRLPMFPIPGILLARLAVSTRARGQGLGRRLFAHALHIALQTSEHIGVRLFVVDALDANARDFYVRMGMIVLDAQSNAYPKKMVLDMRHL